MIRICTATLLAPFRRKPTPPPPPPQRNPRRLFLPDTRLGPLFDFGSPGFPQLIPLHLLTCVSQVNGGLWFARFQEAAGIRPVPINDDTLIDLQNALGFVERPPLRVRSE